MQQKKIIIASHKKFSEPLSHLYLPIHVGAEGKESIGYMGDNTGNHISAFNPYYSELTGLYWAWKNLGCDYLGLVHYRRYFSGKKVKFKEGMNLDKLVLTEKELENFLNQSPILVPKKRRYYIETLYSHYAHTLDPSHLDESRKIIEQCYPDYLSSYDKVMKQTHGYMFNMFIMRRDYVDEYCSWLFDILFRLQEVIDVSQLSAFEARLFGRVSELLFNVWLDKKGYEVLEVPYFNAFEVNWVKKGGAFLKAKFLKKKYKESF